MSEFKSFNKIENIKKLQAVVTEKLHGSNAQVVVYEEDGVKKIKAGSRNRFLTLEDDNFGFARFVHDNSEALIELLGVGTHYGEWVGPGINSGCGLKEKTLVLFNHHKFSGRELHPRVKVVPVLYKGSLFNMNLEQIKKELKEKGSVFSPGFMRPEGVVITIGNQMFKDVFDSEETGWTNKERKEKIPLTEEELALLQPIRMEKLLSRDERLREMENIATAVYEYIKDLEEETRIKFPNKLRSEVYRLVRSFCDK